MIMQLTIVSSFTFQSVKQFGQLAYAQPYVSYHNIASSRKYLLYLITEITRFAQYAQHLHGDVSYEHKTEFKPASHERMGFPFFRSKSKWSNCQRMT